MLLRVAIFVLNVALATDFLRRQTELPTKTLFLEIYRCKVVQFFTAQPLEREGEREREREREREKEREREGEKRREEKRRGEERREIERD